MSEDYTVETFKASVGLSEKLTTTSHKFDLTKSQIIRIAFDRLFEDLEQLGPIIEESVISSIVRQSARTRK